MVTRRKVPLVCRPAERTCEWESRAQTVKALYRDGQLWLFMNLQWWRVKDIRAMLICAPMVGDEETVRVVNTLMEMKREH